MKILYFIITFLTSSSFLFSQSISLNDKIPIDTNIRVGKLNNGLTYIIRKNPYPLQKAEMRLIVNVGSIVEDSSQLGIAHFIEHMAFNGTKHFKKNELISYLQSLGVRFGADLNAYTGFDETVYMLPIPLTQPQNLDKGLEILQDWASGISLQTKDIEEERKIILEEARLGKNAQERMTKKILPGLFANSLYADRLPIGKDSIILNASAIDMQRFYSKWYRPDLMAVVVVGDVNPQDVEAKIKKYFGKLKNPKNATPRTYPTILPYKQTLGKIVTDAEATANIVMINFPAQERKSQEIWIDYKNDVVKNIFMLIMNQRFEEKIHTTNPPYLYASFAISANTRKYENPSLSIAFGADMDIKKGIATVLNEWNRIKQIGISPSELERAKNDIASFYKNIHTEKTRTETSVYTEEYTRFFLEKEPSPGIDAEYRFVEQILPNITCQTIADYVNRFKQDTTAFVALVGLPSLQSWNMDTLISYIDEWQNKSIDSVQEIPIPTTILDEIPTPESILKEEKDTLLGTTELWLSNGIRITLKKTNFKNDEIFIAAVRRGGKSQYLKSDFENASYLNAINQSMGIGKYATDVWKKMNAGRIFSVSFSINELTDNWIASSTQKDLVYCFQTIYLMGTTIPQDTVGFRSFMSQLKTSLPTVKNNPQLSFSDTMVKVFYNNNPYVDIVIPTEQQLDKVNLSRLLEIYQSRANDFANMHFVIVGSFNDTLIKKLITTYIASLPTTHQKIDFVDLGIRPIKGKNNFEYYKSNNNQSIVYYRLYKEIPYSDDMKLKMELLEKIFRIRLVDNLREKMQGTYTLNVNATFEKYPYPNSSFSFIIPGAPENTLRLWKMVQMDIIDILRNGPTEQELLKAKQELLQQHKEELVKNQFWITLLTNKVFPQDNTNYTINMDKYILLMTTRDIQRAAQWFLNSDVNSFRATWYPEKAE